MTTIDTSLPFLPSPDTSTAWRDRALCKGQDTTMFYDQRYYHSVRKMCAECPSRSECLDFAVRNDIRFGLWGGLTHKERVAH